MRRLMILIVATLVVAGANVEGVLACKLCCRTPICCCQPKPSLPPVCGPARAGVDQAVEPSGQPVAEPPDGEPAAAPEVPTPSQIAEPPAEQPSEAPAAVAEEATPAGGQAAAEPDSGVEAEEPAGGEETMSDTESIDSFFGDGAKEPTTPDNSAPAEEPEAPKPAEEPPTENPNKSEIDSFFSMQTQELSPGDSRAENTGFRTWRDVSGRYQLTAKFVACFDDGTVRLVKPNGRWVRLPYAQLSEADQLVARQVPAADEMIAMAAR